MAATKTKAAKKPKGANGAVVMPTDVLTLAEAAAYLRVEEEQILSLVRTQELPGRRFGEDWRFLKSTLQAWLSTPQPLSGKEALLAMAGKFKDDPDLEEICREAYRKRGRPITEDTD